MNHRLRSDVHRILAAGGSGVDLRLLRADTGGPEAASVSDGERLAAVVSECERLGYEVVLGEDLREDARESGRLLANQLRSHIQRGRSVAILSGGDKEPSFEGSRPRRHCQLAMAAAPGIAGVRGAAVFSVGGWRRESRRPVTGGYVDEDTMGTLSRKGLDVFRLLRDDEDAYIALRNVDGLVYFNGESPITVGLLRK